MRSSPTSLIAIALQLVWIEADPTVVVTYFEIAAMQAVRAVFGEEVVTKGVFSTLRRRHGEKSKNLDWHRYIKPIQNSNYSAV